MNHIRVVTLIPVKSVGISNPPLTPALPPKFSQRPNVDSIFVREGLKVEYKGRIMGWRIRKGGGGLNTRQDLSSYTKPSNLS